MPPDTDDDDGVSRRRLIRWVAVLAFAVPVVVELLTFGGLLRAELFGGTPTPTGTATPTDERGAVGVGEELLEETAATETVRVSEVRTAGEGWTYVLRVEVENDTDAPVELRLEAVELRDGTVVEGASTTGSVPPGGTGEVTRAWDLPSESMPTGVRVRASRDGATVADRTVPLERPPLRG